MKRGAAHVVVLGMPGAGRTETSCRLVEALTAAPGEPRTRLPTPGAELAWRGLMREDPAARAGQRTTRQILDAVLRRGERDARLAEDQSLFVEVGERLVEVIDAAGARLANDRDDRASAETAPLFALERAADALVLVLPARRWASAAAEALDRTEKDRVERVLARAAERGKSRGQPLPVALVLVGERAGEALEAPHATDVAQAPEAVRALLRKADPRWLEAVWEAVPPARAPGELARTAALLRARLGRRASRFAGLARYGARALAALALLGVLVTTLGALDLSWHARAAGPADVIDGREGLEGALAARARWRWLAPARGLASGLARIGLASNVDDAVTRRAERLGALVRAEHPAALEPPAACQLKAAQYKSAADTLALCDRVLGGAAHAALVLRLREKTRAALMPVASVESLAAWEELYRSTRDEALREGVVAPAIRPVLQLHAREAAREAREVERYPDLLEPVRARQQLYVRLADDAFDRAQEGLWPRATELALARVTDGEPAAEERLARLGALLEVAPEAPPASFRAALGRAAGEALIDLLQDRALAPHLAAPLVARLGPEGWAAALEVAPRAYAHLTTSPPASGRRLLEGLRRLVASAPKDVLAAELRAEVARLEAHLADLFGFGRYALQVVDVEVSKQFWTFLGGYDMVIEIGAARAPERRLGPYRKSLYKDVGLWAWAKDELVWRAWDELWIVVRDEDRADAGFTLRDNGALGPFGLHRIASGTYHDPDGRGRIRCIVEPAPPAPLDLTGWPAP